MSVRTPLRKRNRWTSRSRRCRSTTSTFLCLLKATECSFRAGARGQPLLRIPCHSHLLTNTATRSDGKHVGQPAPSSSAKMAALLTTERIGT
uniref:Uncharacterized protein n=1 Tax=Anguilla anguilla TaxID=7936 RepID=A0A0E9X2E2_ANGAN